MSTLEGQAIGGGPAAARRGRRAWRRAGLLVALGLTLIDSASADAAGGQTGGWPQWAVNLLSLLGGGAIAGVAGWVGKILSDYISGEVEARRAFIKVTTSQISDLAQKHYWALANHAGLLAGLLEEYLQFGDFHLLLEWPSPDDRRRRLAESRAAADAHRQLSAADRPPWSVRKLHRTGRTRMWKAHGRQPVIAG